MELAVVNPVAIIGPVFGTGLSTSIELGRRLLNGAVPGLPKVTFGFVDVRDVAGLHVRAMTNPAAAGQRFLAMSDAVLDVSQMAQILRERLGDAARKLPSRTLPNWTVRFASLFEASARSLSDLWLAPSGS